MLLSKRLRRVADLIPPCSRLADIGSDHALLPLFLIKEGRIKQAIIGELGDGPYNRAQRAVQEVGLNNLIDVRQGDGLQVLSYGEVETVVLSGLGGDLIADILSFDYAKSVSFANYIFQPMSRIQSVRKFLAEKGWLILKEEVLEENGRYYIIIQSKPGTVPYTVKEIELEIGSEILKADTVLKIKYLKYWHQKYKTIYVNLLKSKSPDQKEIETYKNKISFLGGILNGCQG